MCMIQISHLNKFYSSGAFHALKDVSLSIKRGEFVAIMGSSGSGKSTLLNIIGLLDKWDSGEYLNDGIDVSGLSCDEASEFRNKKIGFVFQSFNLISHKTVLSNVSLPLLYAGVSKLEREKLSYDAICQMGLGEKVRSLPTELSGGQCQRVSIARAIVTNPSLILADEPTGALDRSTSREIMQILKEINKTGVTVVIVTHDAEIAATADRTIIVEDGVVFA